MTHAPRALLAVQSAIHPCAHVQVEARSLRSHKVIAFSAQFRRSLATFRRSDVELTLNFDLVADHRQGLTCRCSADFDDVVL